MWRHLTVCTLLLTSVLRAQPTPQRGSAVLHELLDRLNTVGTVLMLGAHPDDENTAVMAYFARGRHLRTVYFSATRGEGGQNRIGTEQGKLMGVIRTHELLEARRIDGGEQAFATVVDFGYSKSPEETLEVWGQERLLKDMVRVIRRVRPDVIVSRFPPKPGSGGHGQHTAVGWTGPLAYEAAADPDQFPDLGLPAWRARRYYYNVPTFNRRMEAAAASRPGRLRIELGTYDAVLGKSYAELAGESRSMHRSQAMGTGQRKGSVPGFFEHVAGDVAQDDLLEGMDLTWDRIAGGARVGASLAAAREHYDPTAPQESLPHLLRAHAALENLSGPEVEYKRAELAQAIELASGIWVDASADRWNAVPGSELSVSMQVLRRSEPAWTWRGARISGAALADLVESVELPSNQAEERTLQVRIPDRPCYSQPYWLAGSEHGDSNCEPDASLPGPAPVLLATFVFETAGGTRISIQKPVVYRWIDSSLGERSRPLAVVPPVAVSFSQENRIFPTSSPTAVPVRLTSNIGAASATVVLAAPERWRVTPASQEVRFERRGQERTVTFELSPPVSASGGELKATVELDGKISGLSMQLIEYPHIPATPVFRPASMRVERIDATLLSREVGYVMGAGDKIPAALEQLGASVTLLTAADLTTGDLDRFDAIVTGIRALNTRQDLLAARERVLSYVERGGTLVVQYNTAPFFRRNPRPGADATLAPYPMTPSRLRVTDELAAVTFPTGEHALLTSPNRISAQDFEGWVQERGLYFMSDWDDRYDAVVECSDPGEDPLGGGLLYARYGAGTYVFTGYSWFRQLPAGVPGAYRIFANLISAGKTQ